MATIESEVPQRITLLTEAFGKDLAPQFDSLLDEFAKLNYDAYKQKVEATAPVQDKLSTLAKKVPEFWATSLSRCSGLTSYIAPVDAEVFTLITDVRIVHKEDVRDFDVEFHFAPKNPFFSNLILTKSLTATPSASSGASAPHPHDLEAPLWHTPTPIAWTSPEHNLTKKAPRALPESPEEFDDFEPNFGSFFNWFGEEGPDVFGIGETLLEWKSNALEYAAGMDIKIDSDDEGFSDGEDDSDDDSDPTAEVDLESEDERPKKKPKKA